MEPVDLQRDLEEVGERRLWGLTGFLTSGNLKKSSECFNILDLD
jgi:hypothetical protein